MTTQIRRLALRRVALPMLASTVVLGVTGAAVAEAAPVPGGRAGASSPQAISDEYTHIVIDKENVGLDQLRRSLHESGLQTAEHRGIRLSEGSERLGHHQHVFMWDSSKKGLEGGNAIEARGSAVRVKIRWDALKQPGTWSKGTLKGDNMGPLGGKSTNGAWAYEGDIPRKYLFVEGVDSVSHPGFNDWLAGKGWPDGNGVCGPGSSGRAKRSISACERQPAGDTTEVRASATHDEVAAAHRERVGKYGADVDYVTTLEEFKSNPKAVLTPLRETNQTLRDALGKNLAAEDFGTFSSQVTQALGRDLDAVHALSTDTALLARLGKSVKHVGGVGMKVLPYAGIAATGYAIAEDAKAGDYVNLGFDTVAEGLQVAMVAQPELAVVAEPVLLLEQALQIAYNSLREHALAAQRADGDRAKLDSAPKDLLPERNRQWGNFLAGFAKDTLMPRIDAKLGAVLKSDAQVLATWADSQKATITKITEKATAAASSGKEKARIMRASAELREKVDDQVEAHAKERAKAYQAQAFELAKHTFAAFYKPSGDRPSAFNAFTTRYVDESAKPYVSALVGKLSSDQFEAQCGRGRCSWGDAELKRRQAGWKQLENTTLDRIRQHLNANVPDYPGDPQIQLGLRSWVPSLKHD